MTEKEELIAEITNNDFYSPIVRADAVEMLTKSKSIKQALALVREKIHNARVGIKSPLTTLENMGNMIDDEDHWTEVVYCFEDAINNIEKSD